MIEPQQTTFRAALESTRGLRRHLLLGNGFSISARDAFHYDNLQAASNTTGGEFRIFEEIGTTNFEKALHALMLRAATCRSTGDTSGAQLAERQLHDLRAHLVTTVAFVHPDSGFSLASRESRSCSQFLEPFIGRRVIPHGIVFTTNYDLLLYWTAVRHLSRHSRGNLDFHDGFEHRHWNPSRMINVNLSVVYLHGSLHIFEYSNAVERVVYQHTPVPRNIITQIRERLEAGETPIFVAGGTPREKAAQIRQSAYLNAAFKRFKGACRDLKGAFFTVGHSLSEQDQHLLEWVGLGKIPRVMLGAFGGVESWDGRRAQEVAKEWQRMRASARQQFPLTVEIFDSRECEIWTREDT